MLNTIFKFTLFISHSHTASLSALWLMLVVVQCEVADTVEYEF